MGELNDQLRIDLLFQRNKELRSQLSSMATVAMLLLAIAEDDGQLISHDATVEQIKKSLAMAQESDG